MDTSIYQYLRFSEEEIAKIEPIIDRSMSIIGRQNVDNSKWAINTLARSLTYGVKKYGIPATVSYFLSPRYSYDLVIRPLPGAILPSTGINSLFWTNTENRRNALYWSREFNGWRSWPREKPDKAMSLGRWVDLKDPHGQAKAWLAVTTRATSDDGSLLCCWAPMPEVMQFYVQQPKLPVAYLATCPKMTYDTSAKRFDISPELLGAILGVRGWAA